MDLIKQYREMPLIGDQSMGDNWGLYHGDCMAVMSGIPNDAVHYALWSPAFKSLYTFSDDPRDLSNCRDDKDFFTQYKWHLQEVFRIMKPGRLITMHVMDLPTSITRDGFIGMTDFPAENRKLCEDVGFIFHSRTIIWKSPVSAMQRTKAIGLLHKQVMKDSALSRMGICDQLITMRKPGLNDEPILGAFEEYYGSDMTDEEMTDYANRTRVGENISDVHAVDVAREWGMIEPGMSRESVISLVKKEIARINKERTSEDHKSIQIWQRVADPVWMDIVQSDVLSHKVARAVHDERHISPLQLTPVRRCVDLWSNPGDIVFSPYAGIGTVGYVSIKLNRRFLGAELKPEYYHQGLANLRLAEREKLTGTLFDSPSTEPEPIMAEDIFS